MTKLTSATGPIIRELPIVYKGRQLVIAVYPGWIEYREKGRKKGLTRVDHEVAVAAGLKTEAREAGIKI